MNKGRRKSESSSPPRDVTMKRSTLVLLVALIALSTLISCAAPAPPPEAEPAPQPAPAPTPAPVPETPPAEFEATSLAVTPIVAEPGRAVTVEVEVINVGETEGSHTLTLTVNGVEEEVKDVTVAPGATETAAFILVRDASGMYDIEVAGLTEILRVKQPGAYPRLANYYHPWLIDHSQASALAKWDLISVDTHVVCSSPESIQWIRKQNPNVNILVWISAGLFPPTRQGYFNEILYRDSDESWFLHYGDMPSNRKPPEERRVIMWTSKTGDVTCIGTNPASGWFTYLPHFVHNELVSSGLFDGVFYDCLWQTMWKHNIDIDNDGVADSPTVVKQEYQKGMTQLLKLTRELLGPEAIIFGNPGVKWSDDSAYWDYANGHMQENAFGTMFGSSWPEIWNIYQRSMRKPSPPSRMHWIAVDTNQEEFDNIKPDLPSAELQKMRFGLAITLLGDGYFGFDEGDGLHGQLWWFPEYDASLGLAMGDAQERSDGTWMREFENGVVIANPTSKESTIEFADIHQDVTTGIEGSHFVVPPKDGRIFVMRD